MALGIGPGESHHAIPDRVSTLNMICLLGATPVMIDVDRDNLMITAEAVEAAITPTPKRLFPCTARARLRISTRFAPWQNVTVSR